MNDDDDRRSKKAVGKRIRAIRKHRGIGQSALAKAIKYDGTSLFRVEKGEQLPSTETLSNLAVALDVDPGWILLGGDEGPIPDPTPASSRSARADELRNVPIVVAQLLARQGDLQPVSSDELAFLVRQATHEDELSPDELELELLGRRAARGSTEARQALDVALERQSKDRDEVETDLEDMPTPPTRGAEDSAPRPKTLPKAKSKSKPKRP